LPQRGTQTVFPENVLNANTQFQKNRKLAMSKNEAKMFAKKTAEKLRKRLNEYEYVKVNGSDVVIKLGIERGGNKVELPWRAADWLSQQLAIAKMKGNDEMLENAKSVIQSIQ
jgi:hypothetical protein